MLGERENVHNILIGRSEGKSPLHMPGRNLKEDTTKVDLK
jgi:hypothetical protein